MEYFDFHVHPSLKGGLSTDPRLYNAWEKFPLFKRAGIFKKIKQIIESQSTLKQIEKRSVLSVVALIAMETAFASNYVLQKILAKPKVTPLSGKLLCDVAVGNITYYQMFQRDLNQLLFSKQIRDFNIIQKIEDAKPDKVNVVLSVEGSHSFQDKTDDKTDDEKGDSILINFQEFKEKSKYRLLHLTLTHLTRQIACVHCLGVRMKFLGRDLNRDARFVPDPDKLGISDWGKKIIRLAYDNAHGRRVLIDLKHMSIWSRKEFYQMRHDEEWTNIPIIVSHAGVTGTSIESAPIRKIKAPKKPYYCNEVIWHRKNGLCGTKFNPWTINLSDEDIIEVVQSSGLIGLSLDQRILGFGKLIGEFMSPHEVAALGLHTRIFENVPADFDTSDDVEEETEVEFEEFFAYPEIQEILKYEELEDEQCQEEKDLGGEMLFDLDESDDKFLTRGPSHIDFLANNILHIIKTGLQKGLDGSGSRPDVLNCICLGSDLDGVIDALNFPRRTGGGTINQNNWITIDEYDKLEVELKHSMVRCIRDDSYLSSKGLNVDTIVKKVMTENGLGFLKRNFS